MIWLILFISFGLRLIGINQSLWLDEAISANVARMNLEEIVSKFSVTDFHPPGYYLFLNLWVKLWGNGAVAMRLSSVVFSLITIWLIYKIGILIKDKKVGLWAAALTGINPLLIYYSQELRMYSMVAMILMIAVLNWIKIIKGLGKTKNWIIFNVATGLAFVTFYGSIFLTGAMILYFLIKRDGKRFVKSFWGILVATLGISSLLMKQMAMSGQMLDQVTNWSLVLGKVNLKNLLLIPLKFSIGRISWYPKINYYLVSGGWTMLVLGLAIKPAVKNKKMLWLLIATIVLGIIFSFKSPLMQYFRFLYLVPILMVILAENKSKVIKTSLLMGFFVFSCLYLFNPKMYREDWKGAVASLGNGTKIYLIGSFSDPVKYYNETILVNDIKTTDPTEGLVNVIPYGEEIHGISSQDKMKGLKYGLVKQTDFRGVVVEEWQKQK